MKTTSLASQSRKQLNASKAKGARSLWLRAQSIPKYHEQKKKQGSIGSFSLLWTAVACKPHCIRAQVILYADNHAFGSNANSKIVLRAANIDGGGAIELR